MPQDWLGRVVQYLPSISFLLATLTLLSSQASARSGYGQGGSLSGVSVGSAGSGGVPIVVSVEFLAASGGSAGGGVVSESVEAVVLPVCGYREGSTGASLARLLTSPLTAVADGLDLSGPDAEVD